MGTAVNPSVLSCLTPEPIRYTMYPMAPVNQVNSAATELVDRLITNIGIWLVRRRLSGRDLSLRLGGSHNWLSKRRTGAQSFTVEDLAAIAQELDTSVAELLGIPTAEPLDPAVQDIKDFLSDPDIPRSVRDNVRGALGHVLSLALTNQLSSRRTVARGRAAVKGRKTRG